VSGISDISKTYDGCAPAVPTFSAGSTGDVTVEYSVRGMNHWTSDAPVNAGEYTVRVTVAADANYTEARGQRDFTIRKAAVTVTASDSSITYGDEPVSGGVSMTGFVPGEGESVLSGVLGFSYSYERYDDVGSYVIMPDGLSSENYDISFIPGTLTVAAKTVGLSWIETELTYNGVSQGPYAIATGLVNGDECSVAVTGQNTNAGSHTATAVSVSNRNYTLPEDRSVSYVIGKAPQSAPDVAAVNETVKGKLDGAVTGLTGRMEYRAENSERYTAATGGKLENLPAGRYFVRYAGDENHLPGVDAVVTVKEGRGITATFRSGGTDLMVTGDIGYGQPVPEPETPAKDGVVFAGWYRDEACTRAWNFPGDTVTEDVVIYARWSSEPVHGLSGAVVINDGTAAGAVVTLIKDGRIVFTELADEDGNYRFKAVADGVYTITAELNGTTVTTMVKVTGSDVTDGHIVIRRPGTSSILTASDGLNAAVSGLQEASEAYGEAVTVTMSVTRKAADSVGADAALIGSTAAGKKIDLYLDITLTKLLEGGSPENIGSNNSRIISLCVPYDTEGKTGVTVYRVHGGRAEALTKDPGAGQEGYLVEDGYVIIKAAKFSTYAIGCDDTPPEVGPGTDPGPVTPPIVPPVTPPGADPEVPSGAVHECTDRCDYCGGCRNETCTDAVCTLKCHGPEVFFPDVPENAWYTEAVRYVSHRGIMDGVEGGMFSPMGVTTRAQVVTMLYRMAGSPAVTTGHKFTDVADGQWYTAAIGWAYETGISVGYEDGCFHGERNITRQEFAAMLYRSIRYMGVNLDVWENHEPDYDDMDSVADWAKAAVRGMSGAGIINGKPGNLMDPAGSARRAEAAAMIMRFMMLKNG